MNELKNIAVGGVFVYGFITLSLLVGYTVSLYYPTLDSIVAMFYVGGSIMGGIAVSIVLSREIGKEITNND